MHKERLFTVQEAVVAQEDKDAEPHRDCHIRSLVSLHLLVEVAVEAVQHSDKVERYQMQGITEVAGKGVDIMGAVQGVVVVVDRGRGAGVKAEISTRTELDLLVQGGQ
jgi:hypothetical protein